MKKQDLRKILAGNIRNLRKQKNLSQEKLADICGFHRTYVGSVERSERNVTLTTLESFAKALEVTVHELITENEKKTKFR